MDHVNIIYLMLGAILSYISQWIGVIIEERRSELKTANLEPVKAPDKWKPGNGLEEINQKFKEDLKDKNVVRAGEGVYYMQPKEETLEKELEKGHYSEGGVTIMAEAHERDVERSLDDDDYELNEASKANDKGE